MMPDTIPVDTLRARLVERLAARLTESAALSDLARTGHGKVTVEVALRGGKLCPCRVIVETTAAE
jgi:hypothetical protein